MLSFQQGHPPICHGFILLSAWVAYPAGRLPCREFVRILPPGRHFQTLRFGGRIAYQQRHSPRSSLPCANDQDRALRGDPPSPTRPMLSRVCPFHRSCFFPPEIASREGNGAFPDRHVQSTVVTARRLATLLASFRCTLGVVREVSARSLAALAGNVGCLSSSIDAKPRLDVSPPD